MFSARFNLWHSLVLLLILLLPGNRLQADAGLTLTVTVMDETAVAVPVARVYLVGCDRSLRSESNYLGQALFRNLPAGSYRLKVEKEGFYAFTMADMVLSHPQNLEVILNHIQEFTETVEVVHSSPDIDLQTTTSGQELTGREVVNLPFPSTRDIRNVLPLLPGVLRGPDGKTYVGGSAAHQVLYQIDGFTVSDPVAGGLDLRLNADAVRSLHLQQSRYSAEYGRASGGIISMETGMGDDHYRFSATDFIPSLQTRKGLNLNNWTPRATFSGPLKKGSAWFYQAFDGEYGLDFIEELPRGADSRQVRRMSSLSKTRVNLGQGNILNTSLLVNDLFIDHTGISALDPVETTFEQRRRSYMFTVKDQVWLGGGFLLETGAGFGANQGTERPQGTDPYSIAPGGRSGNYYRTSALESSRFQYFTNLLLPTRNWKGRHESKIGFGADRIGYTYSVQRRPLNILRAEGSLARLVTFEQSRDLRESNLEAGVFFQDRWTISDRLVLELGLRADWDRLVGDTLFSPRVAVSYMPHSRGNTKLSGGVGLFRDVTNLELLTFPEAGIRRDFFFTEEGASLDPPSETAFLARRSDLLTPRSLNWSLEVEQKLAHGMVLSVEHTRKRGSQGFTYLGSEPTAHGGLFVLNNSRSDRYDAINLTLRTSVRERYLLMASYVRSSARSNAVIDFDIENPVFASEFAGPLPWDVPHRFLSWGFLPLTRDMDLAYSADWRSGYPFSLVNQEQVQQGQPNRVRFPAYFSLNVHVERRLRFLRWQWALRAGVNNLTGRPNAGAVDNNVDSPGFMSFTGVQDRAFIGRVRLLGRR
jgi:hypothetical protein